MTVRIGLIGAGGIAGAHLNALAQIDEARVVATADIKEEAARNRAKLAGRARPYTDFNEMLDKEKLDAVFLCTPPTARLEPIEASLERGLPVFCEKPASNNLAMAEKTCEVIERLGGHVEVGYVLRHCKTVERLKELLADDRIAFISTWYACPMTLDYLKGKGAAAWFFKQEISGGALMDQATHTLDLVRYYAGEAVSVAACGTNKFCPKTEDYTVDDCNAVVMQLADGTVATHAHTWTHEKWRHMHVICGEKRSYHMSPGDSLTVRESDTETVYKPPEELFVAEDRRFVEMVAKGDFSASRSNYRDATETLKLTVRCLEAIRSARFEAV